MQLSAEHDLLWLYLASLFGVGALSSSMSMSASSDGFRFFFVTANFPPTIFTGEPSRAAAEIRDDVLLKTPLFFDDDDFFLSSAAARAAASAFRRWLS